MITLTDILSNFGDVIELNYSRMNTNEITEIIADHKGWCPYNIRKISNRRFGLSLTSLDGGYTGIPDLDSLREYNIINSTEYTESDFKTRTPLVDAIPGLTEILDDWGDELGRSHFLKLKAGGFFPPHRDNGLSLPTPYFRILIPISGFGVNQMKWIQEDKILQFEVGRAYFVNTTKIHSVFSFVDDCVMIVLNVAATERSLQKICYRAAIK